MREFEFRLESLLRLRNQREQERMRDVARVREEIKDLEDRARELLNEEQRVRERLRNVQSAQVTIEEVQVAKTRLNAIDSRINEIVQIFEKKQSQLKEVQQKLTKASQDRAVLENLKDRKWEEYQEEYNKEVQETLDEISRMQYFIEKHRGGENNTS